MVDDTLTARNRINQRNFRARRQNYIRDLEDRLRRYESDGVQATIEIQTAARQVTEQNVKLRALLMSRYGLNDHEIELYLNSHGPPIPANSNLGPISLTPGATSRTADLLSFATTASFQSDYASSQQSASSLMLSPALGLASLHRASDQITSNEPPSKKQRRENSGHTPMSDLTADQIGAASHLSILNGQGGSYSPTSSSQDRPANEQDPDTLSESSNPHTPADQHDGMPAPYHTMSNAGRASTDMKALLFGNDRRVSDNVRHNSTSTSTTNNDSSINTKPSISSISSRDDIMTESQPQIRSQPQPQMRQHKPGDETACEDAARIIASMRGTNDRPEQILLELGCGPSKGTDACKVKNLSIFSLMDSRG